MQLSYDAEVPIGIHGQLIENWPHARATGLVYTGTVPAGVIAVWDTAAGRGPKNIRQPAATGEVTTVAGVAGFASWDPTYPEPPYRANAAVPVLRKGRIAIAAETALALRSTPFVRFATGAGGTVLGSLRADADTATAVAAPYLIVVEGAAAGGIAIVEINL